MEDSFSFYFQYISFNHEIACQFSHQQALSFIHNLLSESVFNGRRICALSELSSERAFILNQDEGRQFKMPQILFWNYIFTFKFWGKIEHYFLLLDGRIGTQFRGWRKYIENKNWTNVPFFSVLQGSKHEIGLNFLAGSN